MTDGHHRRASNFVHRHKKSIGVWRGSVKEIEGCHETSFAERTRYRYSRHGDQFGGVRQVFAGKTSRNANEKARDALNL